MPTIPVSPNAEAAIDRLTLGIDSPRGNEPSGIPGGCYACNCFGDVEPSGYINQFCGFNQCWGSCFDTE